MKFYVDFEATQPEQEIISVGVVAENGQTFYHTITPQFSRVSPYIAELTGLTQSLLDNAGTTFDVAFSNLFDWCVCQSNGDGVINWEFYSYSNNDIEFLKASQRNITNNKAYILVSVMIANMKDYSKNVTKFFKGHTSLIKAFNYLQTINQEQYHNALDDAKMLATVARKIETIKPLEEYPFAKNYKNTKYIMPSGVFYCKGLGQNAKERKFDSCEEAIEWLINTNIGKNHREGIHKDRMATKIMKAIRKNETYMNYHWRRVK